MGARSRRRVGILGGTFDPVHAGHLAIAKAVRDELHLDELILVPAGDPYLRTRSPEAPAEARAEMVALAIRGESRLRLSRVDLERGGPSYSVDTIADLREELGSGAELFYIVGADTLEQLPDWKDPGRLREEAAIVCVGRPGERDPNSLSAEHPGAKAIYVRGPMMAVSGQEIRARLQAGKSIGDLVPASVVEYIENHGLYRRSAPSGGECDIE